MNDKAGQLIQTWQFFLNRTESQWLSNICSNIDNKFEYGKFILNFNFINRKIKKRIVEGSQEKKALLEICKKEGWLPLMDTHFVARLIYLNAMKSSGKEIFLKNIKRMLLTLEHGEAVHFYRMLPHLPYSEELTIEAEEILRTNSADIFAAFSQYNPWPKRHLCQSAWNRMVLKAVFMELELDKVVGLHEKNNIDLYDSLIQYSKERKAASRKIPIDIWQLIFPFLKEEHCDFLVEYFKNRPQAEQVLIVNALKKCNETKGLSEMVLSRFLL